MLEFGVSIDVVIAGGRIVTDNWSGEGTVVVSGGRVLAILDPSVAIGSFDAARVIDASGKLVMPGGVDPHCHLAIPLGAFATLDSFASASAAAVAGGTTTIVDFAIPVPGEDPVEALDKKLEMAHESRCDYAFHGCLDARPDDVQGVIASFADRGVRTVKLFTTYRGELMVDLETIEEVMVALKSVDGLTYIHAEENTAIETASRRRLRRAASTHDTWRAVDLPRGRRTPSGRCWVLPSVWARQCTSSTSRHRVCGGSCSGCASARGEGIL